jgi:hypothetical protein
MPEFDPNTLEIIKFGIEDYESCGYDMKQYRIYYNILLKQKRLFDYGLERMN